MQTPDLLKGHVDRELNQTYTAFSSGMDGPYPKVVTGLWGCPSVCGDEQIKTLLQWCAASLAQVKMLVLAATEDRSDVLRGFLELGVLARQKEWPDDGIWNAIKALSPEDRPARRTFAHVKHALGGV